MTDQTDDPIDRLIDHAARGMTMGEPSARFEDLLQARLKKPRPVSLLFGFHVDGVNRGFQVVFTATVVVMLVLLAWLARRPPQPPSTAAGIPAATERDIPLAESRIGTNTSATDPGTLAAQRQRAGRMTRPLPPIEPLALESLALEPIDEAPPLDLAAIEVAPLRLDPRSTVTLKENQ
jgi:hypothetical protein